MQKVSARRRLLGHEQGGFAVQLRPLVAFSDQYLAPDFLLSVPGSKCTM